MTPTPVGETPRYFGGPLDGQSARRLRGQFGTFRDEAGAHLAAKVGDALLHRNVAFPDRRAYLLVGDTYIWIPDWRAWRQTPAGRRSA